MKKRALTLAMAVLMAMSLVQLAAAEPLFSDVPDSHPHKADVEFCAKNEFIKGYQDGTFKPDGQITREHFVTVWARTFHGRQHNFDDVTKTKDELDNSIVLMYGLGYINGVSSTQFSRYTNITRQEVAKVVENTYMPGADGNEAYKEYGDHAEVEPWAQNAVSVCKEKGIFDGIAGENFEPKKPITRSEVCAIVRSLMKESEVPEPTYSISVETLTGGTITPDKTEAKAGETITLTIKPDEGKQLKAGTLKYNDKTDITGTTFTMPSEDVVISAEFEEAAPPSAAVLDSIEITTAPSDTAYTAGEKLNLTGLVVTAKYSDGSDKAITDYTTTPSTDDELTEAMTSVEVSHTEGDITKTASFNITVSPAV